MKHVVKTIIIFLGLVVGEPVSYVDVVAPKSDVLLSFRPALGDVHFNTPRQTFLEVGCSGPGHLLRVLATFLRAA